jgi:hypothetical protein
LRDGCQESMRVGASGDWRNVPMGIDPRGKVLFIVGFGREPSCLAGGKGRNLGRLTSVYLRNGILLSSLQDAAS